MKNKKGWILMIIAALLAFVFGVSGLIQVDAGNDNDNNSEKSHLVGVLVTPKHLEVEEGQEQLPQDQFEQQGGMAFYCFQEEEAYGSCWSNATDEGISDTRIHLHTADDKESITLQGTIYSSTQKGWDLFFLNPVYQKDDGPIYALPGSGESYSGVLVDGMKGSHTLEENSSIRMDGQEKSWESKVTLEYAFINPPIAYHFLEFDANHQLIAQKDFTLGKDIQRQKDVDALNEYLDSFSLSENADYVLVETVSVNSEGKEQITRSLAGRSDEFFDLFILRPDGLCVKRSVEVK